MSLTHSVGVIYRTNAGQITNTTDSFTGTSEAVVDEDALAIGTDTAVTLPSVDQSAIKSLVFWSDKAMTVKTNSSTVPDDTITLAAGIQLVWNTNHTETNPITTDITGGLFVTNAAIAKLKVRILMDATP